MTISLYFAVFDRVCLGFEIPPTHETHLSTEPCFYATVVLCCVTGNSTFADRADGNQRPWDLIKNMPDFHALTTNNCDLRSGTCVGVEKSILFICTVRYTSSTSEILRYLQIYLSGQLQKRF